MIFLPRHRSARACPSLHLTARAASPRNLSARACPSALPNRPCGLTAPPRHPCVPCPIPALPCAFHILVQCDLSLVSSDRHGGVAPTHTAHFLCFCAFELAVASCTPLVAKIPSHLSPLASCLLLLTSCFLPLASCLLPLASCLLPLASSFSPPFISGCFLFFCGSRRFLFRFDRRGSPLDRRDAPRLHCRGLS